MKQKITQAEIKTVLERYEDACDAAMTIRNRLNGGAPVERGTFAVESDGSTDEELANVTSLCINGLSIESKEKSAPEWVTETPQDLDYKLEVWDENTTLQEVALTRSEYVALKEHIAKMRGLAVLEVAHA